MAASRGLFFALSLVVASGAATVAFSGPRPPRPPVFSRDQLRFRLDERGRALIDAYRERIRRAAEERARIEHQRWLQEQRERGARGGQ